MSQRAQTVPSSELSLAANNPLQHTTEQCLSPLRDTGQTNFLLLTGNVPWLCKFKADLVHRRRSWQPSVTRLSFLAGTLAYPRSACGLLSLPSLRDGLPSPRPRSHPAQLGTRSAFI